MNVNTARFLTEQALLLLNEEKGVDVSKLVKSKELNNLIEDVKKLAEEFGINPRLVVKAISNKIG